MVCTVQVCTISSDGGDRAWRHRQPFHNRPGTYWEATSSNGGSCPFPFCGGGYSVCLPALLTQRAPPRISRTRLRAVTSFGLPAGRSSHEVKSRSLTVC